jgi:hypothetical protein
VLRAQFGIVVPLSYTAGPLTAGVVGAAAAGAVVHLHPGWELAALAAGLGAYAAALKTWLAVTGDRLALDHLHTD